MEEFQVYEKYCQNKPRSESLWRQCSDCPFFQVGPGPRWAPRAHVTEHCLRSPCLQECQRKLDHKLSLDSYLLKPVQRITKYQLLLKVGGRTLLATPTGGGRKSRLATLIGDTARPGHAHREKRAAWPRPLGGRRAAWPRPLGGN